MNSRGEKQPLIGSSLNGVSDYSDLGGSRPEQAGAEARARFEWKSAWERLEKFLSNALFLWVSPLLKAGSHGALAQTDLLPLPAELEIRKCVRVFQAIYKEMAAPFVKPDSDGIIMKNFRPQPIVSLYRVLNQMLGRGFYHLGVYRLAADILSFCGPLLLFPFLSFLDSPTAGSPVVGVIYALLIIASSVSGAIISAWFNYCTGNYALCVRTCLMGAIYRKCTVVSSPIARIHCIANPVNLVSTDAERVAGFCGSFHGLWSLPLQISIALFFLYLQLGISFMAGVGVALILVPINKYIASKIGILSACMMTHKDSRVSIMQEILMGIKLIKYMPIWKREAFSSAQKHRRQELKYLRGRKFLDAVCVFFWATTPVLISILTFSLYAYLGNTLNAAKIFSCLALFNMLITPLNAFPWVIHGVIEAYVSAQRIENYLSCPEIKPIVFSKPFSEEVIYFGDCKMAWSLPEGSQLFLDTKQASYSFRSAKAVHQAFKLNVGGGLHIEQGRYYALTGPVGSGKTTMLLAILNEVTFTMGDMRISKLFRNGICYCGSNPWILNCSIRENILFGLPYQAEFYFQVLFACDLIYDICQMSPSFDHSPAGENGSNLSGGQKARIALARAVYQRKNIYLLDDPYSAVDPHVADHIFKYCIDGLLHNITRIVTTHNPAYFSTADVTVKLSKNPNNGCYHTYYQTAFETIPTPKPVTLEEISSLCSQTPQFPQFWAACFSSSQPQCSDPCPVENSEKGVVRVGFYLSYAYSVGILMCVLIFLFLSVMQISRNVSDCWLSYWIESSKAGPTDTMFYLKIYAYIGAVNAGATFGRAFLFAWGALRAASYIHDRLLASILNAKMHFFDGTPSGRILNRFSSDLYAIDESLPFQLNIFFAQLFSILGSFSVMCYSLPPFLFIVIPVFWTYLYLQSYYRKTSRELKRLEAVTRSPIYSHISETVLGFTTIRSLGLFSRFIKKNYQLLAASQVAVFNSQVAVLWFYLRLQLVAVAILSAVSLISIAHHFLWERVDSSLIGLCLTYSLTISGSLSGLVSSFAETEKEMVSVERILEYCKEIPQEEQKPPKNSTSKAKKNPLPSTHIPGPSAGLESASARKIKLAFVNLSLRYPDSPRYALEDISFSIYCGEKVGIVGRTGAGKSSLFAALFRLVEASSGAILVDGEDISLSELDQVRSRLAIIPQQPVLFSGSIRYNLDPTGTMSDFDLWTVVEKCKLTAVLQGLSGQLDYVVCGGLAADSNHLSTSECQLLCLARALLMNAEILCIDEATANADVTTDLTVQETIRSQFPAATVLTVAHRMGTILGCEKVLVMKEGRLVEMGAPEELLDTPTSLFRTMVATSEALAE